MPSPFQPEWPNGSAEELLEREPTSSQQEEEEGDMSQVPARPLTTWSHVAAMIVAVAVAACGGNSSQTGASSATTLSVRLAVFPASMPSLPIFVAKEMGFFSKNHVDATLNNVNSGSAAVQALVAGGVDFTISTIPQVVNLRDKGTDVRVVAPMYRNFPQDLWCRDQVSIANAHSYPAVMQDLKGHSVAITAPGSLTDDMVKYTEVAANLPTNYMREVAVGAAPNAIAALKAGSVDCAVAYQPMQAQLTADHLGRSILSWEKHEGPSAFNSYSYNQVSTTKSYIDGHAAEAKAVRAAISDADSYIANPQHAPEIAKAIAKDFPGFDVAVLQSIISDEISKDVSPTVKPEEVANAMKVGLAIGEVQSANLAFNQIVWQG
jgi:NitT/TauT family transport system substrate-binding protein